MPVFNKLVRDYIPEIIKDNGKDCRTRILDEKEYIRELRQKIHEELAEYMECQTDQESIEELADMLEIIRALAKVHGASSEKMNEVSRRKAETRGGFQKRIFLIDVEDES